MRLAHLGNLGNRQTATENKITKSSSLGLGAYSRFIFVCSRVTSSYFQIIEVTPREMELKVKSPTRRSPSPLSPPGSRLAKLPPISDEEGGDGGYIPPALMQGACTELKESMGHLLGEVSIFSAYS